MLDGPTISSQSLSLLLSYGGLSCQVTLNSERPPTRQNRLKVLAVRVFITRLAKPRLSPRPTPPHRHVWASMFCSPRWIHLYVSVRLSQLYLLRFSSVTGQPKTPHIGTWTSAHVANLEWRQQIVFLSSFLARSHSRVPLPLWFTSQPTYLELSSISGALRRPRIGPNA